MTLRIFARSDDALRLLLVELGLSDPMLPFISAPSSSRMFVASGAMAGLEVTAVSDESKSRISNVQDSRDNSARPRKRHKDENYSNAHIKDEEVEVEEEEEEEEEDDEEEVVIVDPTFWPAESRALVPYDEEGRRLAGFLSEQEIQAEARALAKAGGGICGRARGKAKVSDRWMWWDLRDGAPIKLHKKHNCVHSRQPAYKHIKEGLGKVLCRDEDSTSFVVNVDGTDSSLY
jgi:hypothetical protein